MVKERKMSKEKECAMGESHSAHMAVNGECPWCGAYDSEQGGMSIAEAEGEFA